MPSVDVELVEPEPAPGTPARAARSRPGRRTVVVLLAAGLTAAGALVGLDVLGDDAAPPSALPSSEAISAHLGGVEDGYRISGQVRGPESTLRGAWTSEDGPWTADVTAVCTSVDGAPVQVTVHGAGGDVAFDVECSHGGDPDAHPVPTTRRRVALEDTWSLEVTAGSVAAVAVVAA